MEISLTLDPRMPISAIDPKQFPQQLDALLKANLAEIDRLLQKDKPFTWGNLMTSLDDLEDKLEQFWSPLEHLHAVVNNQSLRTCYKKCLPLLSQYGTAVGQNKALYNALSTLDTTKLDAAQKKILKDSLRNFTLAGVALSEDKKSRFEAIVTRLSELSNVFEMHLLDATQAFSYATEDIQKLSGLPQHALHTAKQEAEAKKMPGWLFTLETPAYLAVMTYADDRALRELFYQAYMTRASDTGPNAHQFDNGPVINEMLALRAEQAALLGFPDFASLSLATKMADSTKEVMDFLTDLTQRGSRQAHAEFQALVQFARNDLAYTEIAPWDLAYISEKYCQKLHKISQEALRAYFPLDRVLEGLFLIVKKLYGIRFEPLLDAKLWHPDALGYQISDEDGATRGYVYCDLFARSDKRGGAWMGHFQSRRLLTDGTIQLPMATLTCNFTKPTGSIAQLTHEEVLVLFHEFGHCLQHLLTKVDYYSASGINGIEWDAVELASQIFENWCWDEEALTLLTRHVETKEALPKNVYKQLIASKNFQSAMALMRQMEFALFDFRIHAEYKKDEPFIVDILQAVRQKTRVVPTAPFDRFQNGFSHIFAGGYEAGYYSYKWAEVLSADAFARFEDEGVFNAETGRDFLHTILEVGSAQTAKEAFRAFRGRDPAIDALLRHNGIR